MNSPDPVQQLLIGIVIAVVTSILTVTLALARFRSEKWWERQCEEYINITTAFYNLRRGCAVHISRLQQGVNLDPHFEEEVRQSMLAGSDTIRRANAIGPLLISKRAAEEVTAYCEREIAIRNESVQLASLIKQEAELERVIAKFVSLAKKDLGIARF